MVNCSNLPQTLSPKAQLPFQSRRTQCKSDSKGEKNKQGKMRSCSKRHDTFQVCSYEL